MAGDYMGIGAMIVSLVLAGLLVVTVISIIYLTCKELKKLIQERLERNRKSKVAFGETRKIVKDNVKKILANAPSMTMEELERTCEETPYFVVDYDPVTDEISDFSTIKTESTDEKIKNIMNQNDGIILFD